MATSTHKPNASVADSAVRSMPTLARAAEIVPSSFNESDNTVDVVWTTGARVRRYDWWNETTYEEELVVTAESVDMTRFDAGVVQVIDAHNIYGGVRSIIGVAIKGGIEDGEGRATLKLSVREEMAGIVADIKAGVIRAISFGYNVTKYEITRAIDRTDGINMPLYRAVSWQPFEISFVPVPADAAASTREQPSGGFPCEFTRAHAPSVNPTQEPSMSTTTDAGGTAPLTTPANNETQRAADQANAQAATDAAQRAADITELCVRHGVSQLAAGLIRSASTVEQAGRAILDELARSDASSGGHRNVRIETVRDEDQTRMAGMEEAITHRINSRAELTDNGRQYRGLSLLEIGREFLQARGLNTRGMDRLRLATEMLNFRSGMHTTSDFSALFANVANKRLRNSYDENPGTYALWARRAPNAPDFKNLSVVQLGAAPDLLKTNEHGEFKYGTMTDGAETYGVGTYGRIVSLSRASVVNDDLRGFDRLVTAFGGSARRLENRLVYAQLTANGPMSDNKALFHADHGNLATGAGSSLQMSALVNGRTAMRKQKGLQNEELNLAPDFLIVGSSLEQMAYQLTSSNYTPAKSTDVNEFRQGGRTSLTPIVEPILDSVSATAWYLASNNSQIDTVEYCYLDGAEGPVIESEVGFEVDGLSYKCRLDFAAKAVDFRGLQRNDGA